MFGNRLVEINGYWAEPMSGASLNDNLEYSFTRSITDTREQTTGSESSRSYNLATSVTVGTNIAPIPLNPEALSFSMEVTAEAGTEWG